VDPKFQEPTFETTLTDVSELRRRFSAADDNDWPRYKLTVLNTIRSGVRLEQRMTNAESAIEDKLARRQALERLVDRVKDLEEAAQRRRGVLNWLLNNFWQIVILVVTAYVAHRWR